MSMLKQLDLESSLLLYAAGELPPGDREEMERKLASDAVLRGRVAELREELAGIDEAFIRLDRADSMYSADAAQVRAVSRAMKQRLIDRTLERARTPVGVETGPVSTMKRWVGPFAAAAVLALALYVWWPGAGSGGLSDQPVIVRNDVPHTPAQASNDDSIGLADVATLESLEDGWGIVAAEQQLRGIALLREQLSQQ
jgi:anti-sigma factor RsiW